MVVENKKFEPKSSSAPRNCTARGSVPRHRRGPAPIIAGHRRHAEARPQTVLGTGKRGTLWLYVTAWRCSWLRWALERAWGLWELGSLGRRWSWRILETAAEIFNFPIATFSINFQHKILCVTVALKTCSSLTCGLKKSALKARIKGCNPRI